MHLFLCVERKVSVSLARPQNSVRRIQNSLFIYNDWIYIKLKLCGEKGRLGQSAGNETMREQLWLWFRAHRSIEPESLRFFDARQWNHEFSVVI